jgi:uncharacterized membrane protein SpoIIM required for sporulation
MRQDVFERERAPRWRQFEALLRELDEKRRAHDFPRQYRLVCQDLVLARDRQFDAPLVERLNALALRGHQHLHAAREAGGGFVDLFLRRFPRAVRREWRLVAWMCLFFYGSGALAYAFTLRDPDFVYSVVDSRQVAQLEEMYDPSSEHFAKPREAIDGVAMFFHYVGNNVQVAFRTFAGGILFGIGSLFIILFNGLFAGALTGHVVNVGYGATFFPFVIGHGSFELTAIVLAGVAGLRMGLSLIVSGQRSRGEMLREATLRCVPILYGMTVMLVIAAIVEGLWSGQPAIPAQVRTAVGAGLWALVLVWLALGGRRRRAAPSRLARREAA